MSASHVNGVVEAPGSGNGAGPESEQQHGGGMGAAAAQRPEVAVGAAFVGGFLLALLLRRVRS